MDQYKEVPCTCLSLGDPRKDKIPLLHGDTVDMQATDDGMVVSITKIEYSRHERGYKTDICQPEIQTFYRGKGTAPKRADCANRRRRDKWLLFTKYPIL